MRIMLIITAVALSVSFASCRKNGKGGRAQINVHVVDDNNNADSVDVHLIYGANDGGTSTTYDEVTISDYAGRAVFDNLLQGTYVVRAVDTDSSGQERQASAVVEIGNWQGEQHVVIDLAQ